jgi:hypothetical protein
MTLTCDLLGSGSQSWPPDFEGLSTIIRPWTNESVIGSEASNPGSAMQNPKTDADPSKRDELAIDLSHIIGKVPSDGYLIITGLPDGARLSNGHDNGDTTWTLMFDELPNLKFLPGPVRGVVSLKAEIFARERAASKSSQLRRHVPLVLHTDDAVRCAPADKDLPGASLASAAQPPLDGAESGASRSIVPRKAAETPAFKEAHVSSSGEIAIAPPEAGAAQPTSRTGKILAEPRTLASTRLATKTGQHWSAEVDQLFAAAVAKLRHEADQALAAAEERRVAELKELSGAIMRQHESMALLKEETERSKAEAAARLAEVETRWKSAESDWARKKEDLARESERQRSKIDELTAAVAALRAENERDRRAFDLHLKEAAVEAERSLQAARAEWQKEVARCLDAASSQIRDVFKNGASSYGKARPSGARTPAAPAP